MITSKKLLKQNKISHGFFNRNGGKSSGIYKSLNCGSGSNDSKIKVKENLEIVKNIDLAELFITSSVNIDENNEDEILVNT